MADSRLDYSAQKEARLVRSEPPYLRLRGTPGHWRVYEVRGTGRMVAPRGGGSARLASLGPESFTLRVSQPGSFLVRVRATPYWRVAEGPACVGADGQWTRVRAPEAGIVRVVTRFSPTGALDAATRQATDC